MAPKYKSSNDDSAKTDMERLGYFSEAGYATIGDKYPRVDPKSRPCRLSTYKGKQMMTTGDKTRSAQQTGYFEPVYKRIMEKEAFSDPVQLRRQQRLKKAKKIRGRGVWVPSDGAKMPTGLGNHYGTFTGAINHFSNQTKAQEIKKEKPNVITNPTKKGTGYGYIGVTLGPYQEHAVEPYDKAREIRRKNQEQHRALVKGGPFKLKNHPQNYFDSKPFTNKGPLPPEKEKEGKRAPVKPFKSSSPAKHIGGCKAGCFDSYPLHSYDSYTVKTAKKGATNSSGKLFRAIPGPKSTPTTSILTKNVNTHVNKSNYRGMKNFIFT